MFLSNKNYPLKQMRKDSVFGGEMVHYKINCKKMFCMSEITSFIQRVQRMDSETPIQIEMDK